MSEDRVERDTMGEVRVPSDARWGPQTQRAVENFPISGSRLERSQIEALARIKGSAAASVKRDLGLIEPELAKAIIDAADAVARGEHDDQFPIDVFQTGSGTSSNMNMNEVLATLAAESLGRPVHPNDDVNHPLSSNDMFPGLDPHRRHGRRRSRPDSRARAPRRLARSASATSSPMS